MPKYDFPEGHTTTSARLQDGRPAEVLTSTTGEVIIRVFPEDDAPEPVQTIITDVDAIVAEFSE